MDEGDPMAGWTMRYVSPSQGEITYGYTPSNVDEPLPPFTVDGEAVDLHPEGLRWSLTPDDAPTEERKRAISIAKVQLTQSGQFVTRQGIQLHGGIGVTDEHDVGLYFKRMNVLNALFGDEEHHVKRFSALPAFEART